MIIETKDGEVEEMILEETAEILFQTIEMTILEGHQMVFLIAFKEEEISNLDQIRTIHSEPTTKGIMGE